MASATDKGERHHLIRTRHLAVKHHRQQEHQRRANVLEEAQRGEAQTRCRAGEAQQGYRRDHARGHQHQVQRPWVAAHMAGGAVGNTEQVIAATGSSHRVSNSIPVCASTAIFTHQP